MDLLLVEDKDSFRRLLTQALEGSPWTVWAVADPLEALRILEARPIHGLVTDLRLPGMSGLELIRRARRLRPGLRVVLMSAFAETRDIVEAMRIGADDFLPKPFDLDAFLDLLDRLGAMVEAPPPDPREPWIANGPAMQALDAALRRAAGADLPVLFRGERGSGKGRAARRLHVLRHPGAPYRVVEASTLGPEGPSPDLLQSLQGGSLYLSGLEHLAPASTAALAGALDSGPGQRLHWMAGVDPAGALGPDLVQRLGSLELRVPPLRERREDLLPLARLLLEEAARQAGRPVPWLERAAERQLLEHGWPGNLHELKSRLERAASVSGPHAIRVLPDLEGGDVPSFRLPWPEPADLDAMLKTATRAAEAQLLRRALAAAGGDLPRAAEGLGLTLRTLALRLREHGIPLEDRGSGPAAPGGGAEHGAGRGAKAGGSPLP